MFVYSIKNFGAITLNNVEAGDVTKDLTVNIMLYKIISSILDVNTLS